MQQIYKLLSILLSYPEAQWIEHLDEVEGKIRSNSQHYITLEPLLVYLRNHDLIALQENYVQIFDRTLEHSLHLFEHIHGEERTRGQALVDLIDEYERFGFVPVNDELPDHLPLFLEFLSAIPLVKAQGMLSEAIHVIAHIGEQLQASGSAYTTVFKTLQTLCPVPAQPLTIAPVRTMDEALVTFGTHYSGVEPLLSNLDCFQAAQQQTIQFIKKMPLRSGE